MGRVPVSGFAGAVSLLTRFPVGQRGDPPGLARAVPWFPVVGLAVGAAIAASYVALGWLLPPLPAAAMATLAGAVLTGAFHEDGLADVADAFAGGWTRERRLEILDDPRLGTFGALALAGTFVVRVTAIAALDSWSALALLPAAHATSRVAGVLLMRRLPLAAPDGLGASYAAALAPRGEAAAIASGAAVAVALVGPWAAPVLALCALAAVSVGAWARAKIGGITGDVLGATQQLSELAVLLMGAAALHESWPALAWWAP
jgi:adenosylcobinamide-GDP ribazoletransferase